MLIFQNPQLEELIQNSPSLKQKLTLEQLEKFIERARTLTMEGQAELMEKLEQEDKDHKEYHENMFQAAKDIAVFEQELKEGLHIEKVNIAKEAEGQSLVEDQTTEEGLIQKLDQISDSK